MTTLDTLTVSFEADANALFSSLDALDARLAALRGQGTQRLDFNHEIETMLTVTADEAISRALSGAGERLAAAVSAHEANFGSALASAERAMADALQAAVNRLSASINVTIPVSVDGYRLGTAALRGLQRQSLASGRASVL